MRSLNLIERRDAGGSDSRPPVPTTRLQQVNQRRCPACVAKAVRPAIGQNGVAIESRAHRSVSECEPAAVADSITRSMRAAPSPSRQHSSSTTVCVMCVRPSFRFAAITNPAATSFFSITKIWSSRMRPKIATIGNQPASRAKGRSWSQSSHFASRAVASLMQE